MSGAFDRRKGATVRTGGGRPPARERGVFMISVAAELAEMHPQTLRTYEARGLIRPKRSPKGTRLYSTADVELLRRIQEMTAELGLNLAGVERVLALERELEELRAQVTALEARARKAEERVVEAVEEVRRSFRAELVPYARPRATTLVRLRDLSWPNRISGSNGSGRKEV